MSDLPNWVSMALNGKTSESDLLSLVGKDPLINQLIASRTDISLSIKKELQKTNDPIVLKWLELNDYEVE